MQQGRLPEVPRYVGTHAGASCRPGWWDDATAALAATLDSTGGALLDLGEEGRRLCDAAVDETDPQFADGRIRRVQDAWLKSPAVRRLATHPTVLGTLEQVYGRKPFPFQTLNFKQGSEQRFHSDTIHFHSTPAQFMCGVWIALEDVAEGSGELMYKAGSHKLPVLDMQDVGVNQPIPSYEDYRTHYEPRFSQQLEAANLPTLTLRIRKGQAFIWTANLAHGGKPIAKPGSTRRSLVVHFYFGGCDYYTPMLSNLRAGHLHRRLPTNIRTGLWSWPVSDGRLAPLHPKVIVAAVVERLRAQPARM